MNKTARRRQAESKARAFRGYHASFSNLPPGTMLTPGDGCAGHFVYMTESLKDAHYWAHLLGSAHVYEVQTDLPVTKLRQESALSGYEWVTDSASVVRKVGMITKKDSGYCDGCLAGMQ